MDFLDRIGLIMFELKFHMLKHGQAELNFQIQYNQMDLKVVF